MRFWMPERKSGQKTPAKGQGHSRKEKLRGRLWSQEIEPASTCPWGPAVEDMPCAALLFRVLLTVQVWVVVSTFILLREGKNLRHLPRGKNALLIMSRPEFRPKSTWFQSTHSSYYTVVFPVDPLARYFWPQVPSVQRWFFSIK